MTSSVKDTALKFLGLQKNFWCDLFANELNAQEKYYCTRANSAFKYNWSKLCNQGQNVLWANPPFSQLERVITKLVHEPCKLVLVTPNWPGRPWRRILDKIAVVQYKVPAGEPLYETDRDKKPLPAPFWETIISFIDTFHFSAPENECDLSTLKWVIKTGKDLGQNDLIQRVAKYPWTKGEVTMEFTSPETGNAPNSETENLPPCLKPLDKHTESLK